MNWKYIVYGGAVLALAVTLISAYKKAQPVAPPNVAAVPNIASGSSEIPSPYQLDAGIGGVYPLITFPDINGTSPNVTMNT